MIWLLASFAFAQESCDSIYSNADFDIALGEVDGLMAKADIDRAINVLRKTENLLPCMEELVHVESLGRFARHYALISFLQQDADLAVRWGHMFEETAPEMGWGDTAEDHPLRNMMRGQPLEEPTPANEEAGFAIEKKGAVFMNGHFVAQPTAKDEMPYLVQVFQSRGYLVKGYWQEGSEFPSSMVDSSGPRRLPKFYDPDTQVLTPKGQPPPVAGSQKPKKPPIIPLAAGGGLLIASGLMYALAGAAQSKLKCNPAEGGTDCPQTSAELTGLRSRANVLVMGAGIAALGGVAVGVSGVLLDGSPGFAINGRF